MNRRVTLILAGAMAILVVTVGRANAQQSGKWTDLGYIHLDAGAQVATPEFTSTVPFTLYGEGETLTAAFRFASGPVVSGRGGFRLWAGLGLGVGISRFSRNGEADVRARLPHPFYFDQSRNVSGTARGLKREETMFAVEMSWVLRPTRAFDIMLFAGPAYFKTRQDMPTRPTFTETYPYDTATFTGVESRAVNKTGLGFTAGLDLSYLLFRNVGLGSVVRYSRANATFSPAAGSASRVTLGGIQASAGLRIRF